MNSDIVPVVTAFVYSGDKVALIKRSDRVGTYKGKWAAFSGYIERMPFNQALVELHEEAALEPHQIKLRGIGSPLQVDDVENGGNWLVFPFLFELNEGSEIVTDWETEEWGLFRPSELADLDTVPSLAKALHEVWPPFGDDQLWNTLVDVATDTKHGATELARRCLNALGGYTQQYWDNIDRATLNRAIRTFAACRPSMGVFPNLAARLMLGMCREGGYYDLDALVTELLSAVSDSTSISAENTSNALKGKKRIFTLSYSEAVLDAILNWRDDDAEVVVAESLPGGEGIVLYDRLRERGVNVVLVPDSEIPAVAGAVDAVLVGCDAITEENAIQNKVGTLAAVTSARENKVPSYAIAQTFKIVPPGWPLFSEIQSAQDHGLESEETSPAVQIFEPTPISRFDEIFTEEGTLSLTRLDAVRAELGSVRLVE